MERGWKPNVEIYPPCPRCGSSNTKFCYYNNYSLTQPRYFCKGCRRYWTKGGSLRNVPVGGGYRKSRRGKSSLTTCVASRNSPYGGNIDATGSSMVHNNATNIDLAQVYANFLNQRPDQPNPDHQIPQLATELVDPSFRVSSSDPIMDVEFGTRMLQENGMIFKCGTTLSDRSSETYVSEGNGEYFCGFDSIHGNPERVDHEEFFRASTNQIISNYGLPPLPGEELGTWSSSDHMVVSNHMPLRFEPEGQDPADQLISHRSTLDLPNYDTFFKP